MHLRFFVRHKTESEENAYICLHNNLMNMAKKLLTALFLSILAINVFAQSPSGSWEGTLEAGANKLRLVFNFDKDANGNTICSMDSPDQGAKGIPANASIADNGEITVSIPALGVTYEATMKNGLITGIFKQSGYSFDLTLHPGKSEVRRPQNPQPPYPYTTEEVSFTNRDGNAVLHGTLTLPEGFGTKGTTPVVLMVTGSGQQNRDEEVFGHKPFMVIADYLARNGIASLRYDDRGAIASSRAAATTHADISTSPTFAAAVHPQDNTQHGVLRATLPKRTATKLIQPTAPNHTAQKNPTGAFSAPVRYADGHGRPLLFIDNLRRLGLVDYTYILSFGQIDCLECLHRVAGQFQHIAIQT